MAFVRHGDYAQLPATPSAHQPFALHEQGIKQAQQQADEFAVMMQNEQWQMASVIDSSHMLRAWQTADIFQQALQASFPRLQISSFDALAERSVGSVANLNVEQIESIIASDPRYSALPQGWKSDSHFQLPFQGAESLLQAGERVAAHLKQRMMGLERTNQTQVKLVVGHGASFRHAAFHLGILDFDMIAKLSMYHAQPLLFEYFDDGTWQHIAGDWKIRQAKNEPID